MCVAAGAWVAPDSTDELASLLLPLLRILQSISFEMANPGKKEDGEPEFTTKSFDSLPPVESTSNLASSSAACVPKNAV